MSVGWEEEEWRGALRECSEFDWQQPDFTARRALGLCGDREDARDE